MLVADFISRAGRRTYGFEMPDFPCVVHRRKGDLPFWCYAVHADEKSERFLSGGKVAKWLLAAVNRLFNNPRPPPVPRKSVDRSVTIREFHLISFPFYF